MSQKRNISVRKIVQTSVTLVLLTLCVCAVLSASKIQDMHYIKGLNIDISNEEEVHFVDRQAVKDILLVQRHIDLKHTKASTVNVRQMEHILSANPWIDTVQIYLDNNRQLNVKLLQRVPELRAFERDGSSYYLDHSGHILPLSDNYTHYELVFVQVPHIQSDSLNDILRAKMLYIAHLIKRDAFWNAQTSQVVVNSFNDFELIPVMGNQHIRLGDTTDLNSKLQNLFAFYQHIQQRIGWDKYEVLDVRFKDQVVASPSLPWKAPVDRALTNMNWVKTIIGDEKIEEQVTAYPLTGTVDSAATALPVVKAKPAATKTAVPAKKVTTPKPVAAKPAVIKAKAVMPDKQKDKQQIKRN